MILLSFDPAPKNFGYCVARYYYKRRNGRRKLIKIKILEAGKLRNTITQPKDKLWSQKRLYLRELRRLIKFYKPDNYSLERFLSRGRGGALTAEVCNIMIGLLLGIIHVEPTVKLAVTWKAQIRRELNGGIENWYSLRKKTDLHCIDAFLVGACAVPNALTYLNANSKSVKTIRKKLQQA